MTLPTEEELEDKNRILIKEKICTEQQSILLKILVLGRDWLVEVEIIEMNNKKTKNYSSNVVVIVKDKKITGLRIDNRKSISKEQVSQLLESIGQLETLLELEIQNIPVLFISESLLYPQNLRKLIIVNCHLKDIESICQFSNLEWLCLEGNLITEIPSAIGDLINLEKLELYENKITSFPSSISKLSKLKTLNLADMKLAQFPDVILNLVDLEILSMNHCDLIHLPEDIGTLQSLKDLDFSYNKLSVIPSSVGKLKLLEYLTLQYNEISKLPDTITDLSNLEGLYLSTNKIDRLPKSIGKLENLKKLDLSNNPIEDVPPSFANLAQLNYLSVENTKIKYLPTDQLNRLAEFDLEYSCKNCSSPLLGFTKYCSRCGKETGINSSTLDNFSITFTWPMTEKAKQLYLSLDQKQRDGFSVIKYIAGLDENNSYHIGWFDNDKEFEDSVENVNVKIENGKVVFLEINNIWDFDTELFNEALWYFQDLRFLAVDNMQLDFIPENIGRMKDLEFLRIRIVSSEVEELPEFLKMNKNLKGYVGKHKLGEI